MRTRWPARWIDRIFALTLLLSVSLPGWPAVEWIAGAGSPGFAGDGGPSVTALLNRPQAVAVERSGSIIIADAGNRRLRRIRIDGTIETIAGNGEVPVAGDPTSGGDDPYSEGGWSAPIAFPSDIRILERGGWIVVDAEDHRVLRYETDGRRSVLAGTGIERAALFDETPASLLFPTAAVTRDGSTIVTEMGSGRVLSISPSGVTSLFADGFAAPIGLDVDVDGVLLVADFGSGELVRLPNGSAKETIRLSGTMESEEPPVNPPLPVSVIVGRDGNLYVSVPDAAAVFRIDPEGLPSVFLGAPDVVRPIGLALTSDDRLLVADESRHRVISATLPFTRPTPGDADGDGRVTVLDAVMGLRSLVGRLPFHRRGFLALDIDPIQESGARGDRRVTVRDVVGILRMAIGVPIGD